LFSDVTAFEASKAFIEGENYTFCTQGKTAVPIYFVEISGG